MRIISHELAPLSYYSYFLLGYFFKERTRESRIVAKPFYLLMDLGIEIRSAAYI
ncbi:hypothetical protein ACP8HI_06145 [Paenibacillus sp. FA6]|uniref:hypothetical protein n=1 Tax=Paenibacillus sp. FA6 TaxID=3413029 RepID=UPI003F655C87